MKLHPLPAASLLAAASLFTGCDTPPPIPPLQTPPSYTEPAPPNHASTPLPTNLLNTGNGYIIGQLPSQTDPAAATRAAQQAQKTPATPQQARHSPTADLNHDGFVTLDEVVALRDAGLDDREITRRLAASHQVFQLSANQEDFLISRGVSRTVIDHLHTLNPSATPPTSQPR